MNNDAKISVIIPVFNAEKTLERCINSVVEQTYKNWELILIDDGSTDNSLNLCKAYSEKNNKIKFFHKNNGGVSSARNCGIERASGNYIVFVDSDDSVENNYLEILMTAKEKYNSVGHIWTCFQTIDDENRNPEPVLVSSDEKYSFFNRSDIMTLYNYWVLQGPVCKLYDAEIIKNHKLKMPENITLGEDLMFNLEYLDVCQSKDIIVVNVPVYNYYRNNQNSLDHKYRPDLLKTAVDLKLYMHKFILKWNVDENQMNLFFDALFHTYENILSNTMNTENKMSKSEKYNFNSRVMQSDEFKKILDLRTCYVNPLLLKAYRSGNYHNVALFYKTVKLKNSIMKLNK